MDNEETIEELRAALAELESGEGLSRFVEGHGLQSRFFAFSWKSEGVSIDFNLPCGRVLSDEEEQALDAARVGAALRMAILLLTAADGGKLLFEGEASLSVTADEDGARYFIVGPDGEEVDAGDGWDAFVAAARKADVSTIKRLRADTGPVTINRAMLQFFRNFDEILHKAGLLAAVADDATLLNGLQNFIGAAMLGQFGTSKLRAIQEALMGENAADLDALLIEGARDWFARVDAITTKVLDEAVMGKGGLEQTEKFKEQIRDNMERTGRSGFAMLQSILSILLGDAKMKELPDDYKVSIPLNFKMIVEDYAKDTRRQLAAKPKAEI